MMGDIVAGETDWGKEEEQQARVLKEDIDKSTNIRVAVRCRPPNKRELAGGEGGGVVLKVPGPSSSDGIVTVDGNDPFSFDLAFPMDSTQLQVFEAIGVDIVQSAFHGYNASLFAYGQTSSGKSFSMMGVAGSNLVGLIPRISRLLFGASANSDKSLVVETSYLEIYNEKLRDLLCDATAIDNKSKSHAKVIPSNDLKIRENKQLGVHVQGLIKEKVASSADTLAVIEKGFKQRTTAATLYNSESSRSHAVFEINIRAKFKDANSGEDMVSSSRIALIDLAGSERSAKLGSKGTALKEGNNINKSLTVLGRCIRALVEESKGKKVSVPFRESVLTWYLRDSLAGNARTTMLAACSPVASNMEETLSTLRYAASAKNIKTAAKKNEDPAHAKIRELSTELELLKQKLAEMEQNGTGENHSLEGGLLNEMSQEEKLKLLAALNEQMGVLQGSGESTEAKKEEDREKKSMASLPSMYPLLSCLNKDDFLSHSMTISLTDTATEDGKDFTIGRTLDISTDNLEDGVAPSSDLNKTFKNDFELNGMGIKPRHCKFSLKTLGGDIPVLSVEPLSRGAAVYVNGKPLEEIGQTGTYEVSQPLMHLDRIIFGPARLIVLYLTKPLTMEERERWNYDSCFQEMISVAEPDLKDLVSESRRSILNLITTVEMDHITQGNMMAFEMGVPIRFEVDMVVKGRKGVSEPNLTLDSYMDMNEQTAIIRCRADIKQKIVTALDLVNASVSFYHAHKHLSSRNLDNDSDDVNLSNLPVLFEIPLNEFEEVLHELKEAYTSISTLTGGIMTTMNSNSPSNSNDEGASRMVKNVFEALDKDNSGHIDAEELKKGLLIFHPENDPGFITEIWKEENFAEEVSMNLSEFENFLIHFMQRQFYKCIEPHVTNRRAFATMGGRDMYQMAKDSQFKLDDYEARLKQAKQEIAALAAEKEMILKQSQEASAKINFMELEAQKEREHIGGKNMLAVGLVRAWDLAPPRDLHLMGASVCNPRVKFRFVTQEYIDHRNANTAMGKTTEAFKEKLSSGRKWVATSTVKEKTLDPVWNELYYFPTNLHAEHKILEIKVEDWDFLTCDLLGRSFLKLSDIPHDGNLVKLSVKLMDSSGVTEDKPRGTVELALSWVHDDFKAVLEKGTE